jgi:stage V sporulation protein R
VFPLKDKEMETLQEAIAEIWDIAHRLGLEPFPTHFELVPANIMYEFGAYGLPGRFSHWTHGKTYHQIKTMYDYGLNKIYELVINTDPCYAFLLEGNSLLQNKLVVAHVLAHSDFFRHNAYFAKTYRQMLDAVSVNAERIRRYEFEHGRDEVEAVLDAVLSIHEHFDPNVFSKKKTSLDFQRERQQANRATPYDDLFVLDPSEPGGNHHAGPPRRFPEEPEKDVLLFLATYSPQLNEWQRDIVHIVRNEMLYFLPQMQTKIMNEGWASYWHVRIMRELDLTDDEYLEFAQMNANVLAPGQQGVNPYYVGLKIYEDIERRWDNPNDEDRQRFGRKDGEGKTQLFEVRDNDSDVSYLRTYLTEKLVHDLNLFVYKQEGEENKVVETNWEKIRDMLVASMTNLGNPYIVVEDGDYHRTRELYLKHSYEGVPLDMEYAEKTLRQVYNLWGRPVHLETVLEDKPFLMSFDGTTNSREPKTTE